jgi:hypothetical protein
MPRSGPLGTYTLPGAQKTQQPNTVIPSAVNNQGYSDIEQTFNTVQPEAYGGTGAATFGGAADNLSPPFVNVASGATTNIGAATSPNVNITGTATITAFDTVANGVRRHVTFGGIITLTHNAVSLILPGGANIVTAAGDSAEIVSLGSGNWRVDSYSKASGGPVVNTGATKVDVRRNRVVNGDKLVSQENLQTSGTTNGRYISDQNAMYFVTSAGVFTGVNVLTLSPAGGYRDRIAITTADASLAAGEFLTYSQNLEGSNVRDLKWGTADAVDAVARIGFKGPAGTYAYRLGNSAANRSYVALFTITGGEANTDVVREFAIPGDTTGTWLNTDGVIGITRDIVLACGSTFQGVAGWQAGNILGTSGVSNGMGTGAAVFEFFDEGFKADPDATGVYGQYEVGETDAVYRSERYWEKSYIGSVAAGTSTTIGAAATRSTSTSGLTYRVGWTKKSKQPILVVYSTTGAVGQIRNIQGNTDNPSAPSDVSATGYVEEGGNTTDRKYQWHWTANARLS